MSLYIADFGVGLSYGNGPLKWIRWDSLNNASEISLSNVRFLQFRLKNHSDWLSQFTDKELKYLSHVLMFNIFSLPFKRQTHAHVESTTVPFPESRLREKLTKFYLHDRQDQGLDITFSHLLYSKEDLRTIEASYLKWVNDHSK
ncbi:MAG: hypothetical protein QM645_10225 [Asticcacaulis sp.]